ncbi:3-dehydroquinate synthase [Synechococcus sp. Cruz-9H2]|uniref:3-dehydroquinate synthase n=1 Tax=unclassified Synechococcus TaxID=2626047 RepID=UPI0020CB9754|nr:MULTISPECIES: 3-dehydroquinate synthase [unclassified Synechococcus]MCP9817978.1 3-dehydroquinate synthase [Synechococcus sp. Cruz-9H2]MCP9842522.1 3-dehydroquinate synthase [Synechococcus sp. Edmonson 11F2]MCP9854374.1 3-dehydroquinate synthase [Synechococcus sp. Cruz-9C9]MCP9861930.1 3-dehydroquinate synthase [Synechococcus sp. Cruz-7E5]MCP9868886.1 3-dehydroquinate synthase [Synechococcus sp. Cruz-7B9]
MIPALSIESTGAAGPTATAGAAGAVNPIHTIEVALSSQPYPVVIGAGSLDQLGAQIRSRGMAAATKVLVVTNPVVEGFYGLRVLESLRQAELDPSLLVLDAGEDQKTPASVALIHDVAQARRLERSSLIVALGGGVIGDMAGFAAATWLRGIAVVQVPTTLLAMVDASIGGKTGVNHPGGKNLIGSFHQPLLVLIDPSTLATLPEREFRAGMAEVIKYGVIGDPQLFSELEAAEDLSSLKSVGDTLLPWLLERSAAAKARVVAADEREGGLRAILNYGHTLGHVVETLCGYGTYLHGEAVALGMVAAGDLAVAMGLWSPADQQRQCDLIAKAGLPLQLPPLEPEAVLRTLLSDKKVKSGQVRFVLPSEIGKVQIHNDVGADLIREVLSSGSPRPE